RRHLGEGLVERAARRGRQDDIVEAPSRHERIDGPTVVAAEEAEERMRHAFQYAGWQAAGAPLAYDRWVRFEELALTSAAVAALRARSGKIARMAALLSALPPDEIEPAVAFLSGTTPLGRVGV